MATPRVTKSAATTYPPYGGYSTYKREVPLDIYGPGGAPTVGFRKGKGYYPKYPGGQQPGGAQMPLTGIPTGLGAYTPAQINTAISRITSGYGSPYTDQQITGLAQQQIDPLIAALTKTVTDRTQQGVQAINAGTQGIVGSLAGIDWQAPYREAAQGSAAADSALRSALAGSGGAEADQLAAKLAQLGAPAANAVGQATDSVRQTGEAAGNAELAQGSAALQALLANQAAAGSYGLKQPGIVQQSGLQQIGQLQGQAQQDISQGSLQLLGQLPDIVANLRAVSEGRRQNAAQTAGSLATSLLGDNTQRAIARAGLLGDQTKADAAAQPVFDASNSRALGFAADQYGQPLGGNVNPLPGFQQSNGRIVKTPTRTASQTVSITDLRDARSLVQRQAKGFYASQTDPSKPLSSSDIAAAAKTAGMSVSEFLGDADAMQQAGVGWSQITPGGQGSNDDIQRLYLTLVRQYGVPARQAFNIVAGTFPDWGKERRASYFPGTKKRGK